MNSETKIHFFLISLFLATYSFATNPGISYQGRIFKPDGAPLEGSSVQFRMQIRSPGSENCLLYEELQTLNMSGSSGVFAITLNDGQGTRLDSATYPIERIFANRGVLTLDSSRCASGTTYTPNSSEGRKLIVYFKDETMGAFEAMPIMSLNYVPLATYALESQKVDTFAASNILRAVDGSGNPATVSALDPAQLTNLNNLIAGTSTQYATATAFNTVQSFAKSVPPTCGVGEVLKSNGTVLSCVTPTASPSYSGITAATATNTIDNLNFSQNWNWSTATTQSPMSVSANALTTGSLMSVATSSASLNSTSGLMRVANTGASTNGILARFQSNSTAGSGLTVLANGNVGIGTSSPAGFFEVQGGAAAASSAGKSIVLKAQDATGPSGNGGGNITLESGQGASGQNRGSIALDAYQVSASVVSSETYTATGSGNNWPTSGGVLISNAFHADGNMGMMMFGGQNSSSREQYGYLGSIFKAGAGAYTPAIVIGQSTGASSYQERVRIDENGNVGIKTTSPRAALDVSGAILSNPAVAVTSGSTVNFASNNLAYSTMDCKTYALWNLKDGGTYSFAVQGTSEALCAFNAYSDSGTTPLTIKMPPDHDLTTSGTQTLYSILVMGSTAYVSWIPSY